MYIYILTPMHTGREDLVVVAPIPNSPAEIAGIQPLDRLLRIDDVDVQKYRLTAAEGTTLLRGIEDTEVRVLVQVMNESLVSHCHVSHK